MVFKFLNDIVFHPDDPRGIKEALKGWRLGEFCKYRERDYRIIAKIEDGQLLFLIVRIGNRRDFYC